MSIFFERNKSLNNIPSKKLDEIIKSIENSDDTDQNKRIKNIAVNRYAESNIPIEYWFLKIEKDFEPQSNLLSVYNSYISDLKSSYINGTSICLAGSHGLGKTYCASSILKKASSKGFSCLYTTLGDIVSVLARSAHTP